MENKKISKKGISLILLVITIIIMIILAGAIVLDLTENNPIGDATETKFKTDLVAYRDELDVYISDKKVDAARSGLTYDPEDDTELDDLSGASMLSVLTNYKDEYDTKLAIKNGKLVYVGEVEREINWTKEVGIATTY